MTEIRRLMPLGWLPSEPLVAFNNHDQSIVSAAAMTRGNDSYYDRYGFHGSRQIVCIDCKEEGREAALSLVESKTRRAHFRHQPGEAPDGLRRHGETAEHLRGKTLISEWAREQHHILPWTVQEEVWVTGASLRSDVRAELSAGGALAFEVQRRPMTDGEWARRHGGYTAGSIKDTWLWSPETPDPVIDMPLTSVVLDLQHEEIGILVARTPFGYRHPTAGDFLVRPTHYAAAPLPRWSLSVDGALLPPEELLEFIGTKLPGERQAQLERHRDQAPPLRPSREAPQSTPRSGRFISQTNPPRQTPQRSEAELRRIQQRVAELFGRD